MPTILQVLTATPDRETALTLARSARLAATAHLTGPIPSVFWHEGTLGEAEEWHLHLKTTPAAYPTLESHLLAAHPWTNPEITATPITHASPAYAAWLQSTLA